jgi:glucosamine 6-phosphate synthetase-like amidotransferase/phosphosugar isomerase protein
VNPELFLADLERAPDTLEALSTGLARRSPWEAAPIDGSSSLVLLGMGSSHYANQVAAARLRAKGVRAVAELASSDLLPEPGAGSVVVAVSAGGSSTETLDAAERYRGRAPIVALTNREQSPISELAVATIQMEAGDEVGGVACRSFQHTLALLLALEERVVGGVDAAGSARRAAEACAAVVQSRPTWLPEVRDAALGPDGTHLVAPARRLSSALQGALMLREGPRLPAIGCETGDWSHVDVYLTKTTDYRMMLFTGSRWEPELLRWVVERGSRVVCVGSGLVEAEMTVGYPHADDDTVRLLSEVMVPSLIAAVAWLDQVREAS